MRAAPVLRPARSAGERAPPVETCESATAGSGERNGLTGHPRKAVLHEKKKSPNAHNIITGQTLHVNGGMYLVEGGHPKHIDHMRLRRGSENLGSATTSGAIRGTTEALTGHPARRGPPIPPPPRYRTALSLSGSSFLALADAGPLGRSGRTQAAFSIRVGCLPP